MRRLHHVLLAVICVLVVAVSADVQAEGFMSTPPKVGTAVTYSFETKMFREDDDDEERKGEITLSCVGKEEVDGAPAYWIEVKRPGFRGDTMQVYKLLVREKKFAAGENPFDGFVRGYFKQDASGDEFAEIDIESNRWRWRRRFLAPIPSFENLEGEATEKVTLEGLDLGALECHVRTGTIEFTFGENGSGGSDGQLFLSDKVPFGLVQAEITTDIEFGEGGFSTESTLILKKIVTKGAKTEIPDAK